jgi:hypothetical protein
MELYHGTSARVGRKILRGEQLFPWTPADEHPGTAREHGRTKDSNKYYAVIVLDRDRGGFQRSITGFWDSDHDVPVPTDAVIRVEFWKKGKTWR